MNESGVRGTLNTTKHHAITRPALEEDQSNPSTRAEHSPRLDESNLEQNQPVDLIPIKRITETTSILDHAAKEKREFESIEDDYRGERRKEGKRGEKRENRRPKNKIKQFREPNEKPNHNVVFYDVDNMPIKSLYNSFGNWSAPSNFTASKFKVKVTEDSVDRWTTDHEWNVGLDSDMWRHCGHLKFENINMMKILSVLSMYDAYIQSGDDYVLKTNKEKVWGNDKDLIYVGIKNLKSALVISYIIGGAAVPGCFLGALSNHSGFRMQFANPDGDYSRLHINWESHEWYENLKETAKKWILKTNEITFGILRRDLLKRRFDNDQKCLKADEIPLNISQNMVPMHPENILNPLSKFAEKIKPSTRTVHRWKQNVEKGNFNLVNDTGGLIRFFRAFKDKNAQSEVDYRKKMHEIQEKHLKDGGLSDKQLGKYKSTRRRTTMNKLRQISVTNTFLKTTDHESNLHKGFAYMFMDTEKFGTLDEEDLFVHLMEKEKERCPTNFMNDYNSKDPEAAVFKQMWANCGGEAENREWLMKLLHHMKKNHDKQFKILNGAIHKTAAFAAETRNIMLHKTTTNGLKGDLALHLISGMMKKNGGTGVKGYGEDDDIKEVSDFLESQVKMEADREGGIPTIYNGDEIIRGNKDSQTSHKAISSGDHYDSNASGLCSKKESEHGLVRKRGKNTLLTNEERKCREKEDNYKRRRLQECDNNPEQKPEQKPLFPAPKPKPKPKSTPTPRTNSEPDTCEQLGSLSDLGIHPKPTSLKDLKKTENQEDTEVADEPSTMTNLSALMKSEMELESKRNYDDPVDYSPVKPPTQNVAIGSPKLHHNISVESNDVIATPKRNEKRRPDRTIGRVQLVKENLLKNTEEDDLKNEILKKINISDSEVASYNFSDPRYKPEEEKTYKFRQGVNIQTMKTFKWSKKWIRPKPNDSMFQIKITLKASRETWYQYVVKYTQLLVGLLKVFRKLQVQKLKSKPEEADSCFLNECNGMIDDLDNFRRLLDLDTTLEKLKAMDRGGIELVPLPSIALYTAVEKFLPIAAQKANYSLNFTPKLDVSEFLTQTHAKRLESTRINITGEGLDGTMIENVRQGKEFLTNDRFLHFDEMEEKIEKGELQLQIIDSFEDDYNNTDTTCSNNSILNEINAPMNCKLSARPHSTPKKNRIELTEKAKDDKPTIKVSFTKNHCKIGNEIVKDDFLGFKLNKSKNIEENEIKCIKDAYKIKFWVKVFADSRRKSLQTLAVITLQSFLRQNRLQFDLLLGNMG